MGGGVQVQTVAARDPFKPQQWGSDCVRVSGSKLWTGGKACRISDRADATWDGSLERSLLLSCGIQTTRTIFSRSCIKPQPLHDIANKAGLHCQAYNQM